MAMSEKDWGGEVIKTVLKGILMAIAVAVLGMVLLYLIFFLDYFYNLLFDFVLPMLNNIDIRWIPPLRHIIFLIIILAVSSFILKKKLPIVFKAALAMVPVAMTFVTIGMFLSDLPILLYGFCLWIYIGIVLYLRRKKKPWQYFYSVTLIAAVLLIMAILGIDI